MAEIDKWLTQARHRGETKVSVSIDILLEKVTNKLNLKKISVTFFIFPLILFPSYSKTYFDSAVFFSTP